MVPTAATEEPESSETARHLRAAVEKQPALFVQEIQVRGRRTQTTVQRLNRDARIDELARMMGGASAGEQARAGALELLDRAGAKGEGGAKAKGESRRAKRR